MESLAQLIAQYAEAKRKRMAFERLAAEIKADTEDPLKEKILIEMTSQGVKSVKLEGIGMVSQRETEHYEVVDLDKLAKTMFHLMLQQIHDDKPVMDAVLLQSRIKKDVLEAYVSQRVDVETATDADLAEFGVKRAVRTDLSITKR